MNFEPKKGDLRVWWIPQIPMNSFYVQVESIKEAMKILTVLADYDIFQYENKVKPDYSNVGGLHEWDGSDWIDYEDEEGKSIDDLMENLEE